MGQVFADLTLRNAADVTNADSGLINDSEIRETAVRALVDTGAMTIVISEEIRERLGLKVMGLKRVSMANDSKDIAKVTEPVEIKWKDRVTSCQAMVVSGWGDVLLGLIPLEDMDLVVDPVRQELAGAHGDEIVTLMVGLKVCP